MKKLVVGCWFVGLQLLMAQSVLGAGSVFASIPAPDVKFTFDDTTVAGLHENEGSASSPAAFIGSYSSKGKNAGATYVKSMMGYGIHSYSPWCVDVAYGNAFTVEFCFKATTAANNVLLCLGSLNDSQHDALMVTTESANSIKLLRVRSRVVEEKVSIPVAGKMSDYHLCFLRYENGTFTASMDGASNLGSVSCGNPAGCFQILGGFDKQNEMADYPHGCGVVNVDSYYVTEPNVENVVDDLRIWSARILSDDEIAKFVSDIFLPEVPYLEWKDGKLVPAELPLGSYEKVTSETRTLSDGWYVVKDEIVIEADGQGDNLTVSGHAKLILCDGASLTVTGYYEHPGIEVLPDNELSIYGQSNGTGRLTANGRLYGAGIGGGRSGSACGTVTINGGTVTATGGQYGAGIGGGGGLNGTGGTVTINGGTVTATGNDGGAGIGGGRNGSGGAVAINGGRLKVIAGDEASVIGAGRNGEFPGTVEISSGLFAWKPNEDRFVGLGERLFSNTDASTCADYPWVVTTGACVAFGRSLEHATVAWTSGDGTVTNAINGNFFIVPKGTSGVKVIFTPEDRYALDKTEYVFAGAINGDCEIPAADLPTATYLYVEVAFGRDLANLIAVWTSGDGSKTNAISGMRFEVLKGVPFKVLFAPESSVFELVGPSVYESEGIWESMRIPEELIPVAKGMTFEYVDADGSVKLCNNHNALTDATPELKSGWYVVVGKMSRGSIVVNGDVHLILTDDCELTATGGGNLAGVAVEPGNSLVIYGQRNGTGKLTATGGWNAAGIGGQNPNYLSELGNYGTITINGGTVTAMGGENGAGIGGGYKGENGAVAINGGRLKVVAGNGASVIGAGEDGISQGTVAISGGIFTWKPNEEWLVDQSLKFFDNPDASTCADYPWAVVPAVCVTFGREIEHMTAVWTSGDGSETNAIDGTVFRVPKGVSDVKVIFTPEDGYMLDKTEYVFANAINADFEIPAANLPTAIHLDVEVTFGRALDHITAVWTSSDGTLKAPISGLSFLVPKGMPFKVLFAAESSLFELVGPSVYESDGIWEDVELAAEQLPVAKDLSVKYVDADGSVKSCANYDIVTNATSELTDGWYIVVGKVSCRSIVVKGEVHLILTDDCDLTATCEERLAGVAVESGNSLVIYGQKKGTGKLTATCNDGGDGDNGCAGIGGSAHGSGGAVTINGGTVIATGGGYGAGIGGGDHGSGGTITINGGTVTAIGDDWYGAGIGSGRGGAGGTVTINGGTVTAQGGTQAAGIGGGGWGAGGAVTINGGRLKVVAGKKASIIGAGYAGGSQGTVAISGGIFAWKPNDEWLANRAVMSFVDNPDVTTAGDYPWAVYLSAAWVSFGRALEHATAAWTSGDGAVTNAIEGTSFCVPKGVSGVKVIFTPEDRYTLDKTEYVFAEAIDADFVIPDTALPTATYRYAAVAFERAPDHATAVWTSGDGTVTNAIEGMSFEVLKGTMGCKVIFTPEHNYRFVGVGESGVRVLASPLTADCLVSPPKVELIPGTVVNPWNVGEAVTAYVSDEGALVIEGAGEMNDFASAADVPWAEAADKVTAVTVSEGVILGKNALAGFADTMTVNGLSISFQKMVAASTDSAGPSGAISGAEFEQVQIVGGKAYLDVSVYTNSEVKAKGEGWGVATNGVIEVPAPGKQGFFYLMSKPDVPSDAIHASFPVLK